MTILELIDEPKRYDNDYTVFFKIPGENSEAHGTVDFMNSPADKELTLEAYG